ncbi:MAG: 50S ribosomal protein L9 [Hyphomonadaceae bacterium]|nr:50S ribosomal protein L9 [Hyphomonadaceae bacterium]
MQVILLERVGSLGGIGDEVSVRDGYARNFLLPQHKALRATDANRKRFDGMRAEIVARNEAARAKAQTAAEKIDGLSIILLRSAGESGQLYGSVSARDVAEAAASAGHEVPRAAVVLDKPIKTLGLHTVRVNLHPEVTSTVTLNVARSPDEAERQAKGENVISAAQEEDRAIAEAQAQEIAAGTLANEGAPN